jgi:3-oxoacyl-[acyl-carrier-protein] synthase II
MRKALADAGMNPADIDYINAHATSTPLGDTIESNAVKKVFGPHAYKLAMSSTKGATGHLLGAAGGVEMLVCILAMKNGVLPPTINLDNPDPQCDLDYVPHHARDARIRTVMNNAFGFGGHNVSVIARAV